MKSRGYIAAVAVLLVAALPGVLAAEVLAEFNGTPVDSFPGAAGEGWVDGWVSFATRCNLVGTVVDSGGDLGSGPYLDVSMSPTSATQTGHGAVSRRYYDGIDVAKPHVISFKYRIDEDITGAESTFTTSNDRYQLFDTPNDQGTANASCSWIIGVYAAGAVDAGFITPAMIGHWVVFDGTNGADFVAANQVDTAIVAQPGVVYDFEIVIDAAAKKYSARVSDGTTTFSQSGLGWRTTAATVGGRVHFASIGNKSGESRMWSMDSIKIVQIPEPSMLALLAALIATGTLAIRRK